MERSKDSSEGYHKNSYVDVAYDSPRLPYTEDMNRPNRKLCTYYSNFEHCRFGENCKFLHRRPYGSKQFVSKQYTSSRNKVPFSAFEQFPIPKQQTSNLHNNYKKPCRYFKAGNCDRGDQCSFSHAFDNSRNLPESQMSFPPTNSRTSYTKKRSIPICRYFKQGFCKDGNQCKFYHPQQSSTSPKIDRHLTYNENEVPSNSSEIDHVEISTAVKSGEKDSSENEGKDSALTNDVDQNNSCDKNLKIVEDELLILENLNLKDNNEPLGQVDSIISKTNLKISNHLNQIPADCIDELADSTFEIVESNNNPTAVSKPSRDVKIPMSANKVFSLPSAEEEISHLRVTEIRQFMKRFPNCEILEDSVSFAFTFQPSDPDWDFDLKVLKLQVAFPEMYPKEICSISVIRTEDYIPETLFRLLNESISDWLNNRHKAAIESKQVELVFRPFLKWFDKNVECIFNIGLKRETHDKENIASDLQLPTNQSITDTSELPTDDVIIDEKSLDNIELSAKEKNITKETSQVSNSQKRNVPNPSVNTSQNQGVKVLFIGLEFIEGVAALSCTRIAAMLRCIRCKTNHNIKSPPNKNNAVTCTKCSKRLESNFNPQMLHQFSNVLGTMHLVECQVVDINLVESAFLVDCLNCSKQVPVNGIHYGQKQKFWCMFCNQKLIISIGSVKFQGSAPTYTSTKATDKSIKKTEKKKDPLIKEGGPLPQFGACKHYKKSNRWMRFPCCGRVYPCDVCHEEKEMDHEMKFASRMICGFCSKEQPYSKDKPCTSCSSAMVAKAGTHWEGGKGCRNKVKMARDDKHKYAGTAKTVSKKAQSSGIKKK